MEWRPSRWQLFGLAAGVAAFLALAIADTPLAHVPGFGARPARAAAVASLMAIWWLTEALPINVTACVPLALYPLMGVFGDGLGVNVKETLSPYFDAYIFLFLGGMCIGAAMQEHGLHKRIALFVMGLVGTDPARLLFGFLAATAFISLWISNTATAAMMLPIGIAVIAQLERRPGTPRLAGYGGSIMLAIAYGSNVGGIGTKIGTAPNAQLAQFMEKLGTPVSFFQFMAVGLPFVILFLPVVWFALWRTGRHDAPRDEAGAEAIAAEKRALGPMSGAERVVLGVFVATAAAWIAGSPAVEVLRELFPGAKITTGWVEGTAAMIAAVVLAVWRAGGKPVLGLSAMRRMPLDSLLLLGGSFSMAAGIQKSGLSEVLGHELEVVQGFDAFAQVLVASAATVALSAVASNTATTSVMLNVLKSAVSPAIRSTVLFSATISASCDFALPAGTPPNAIVFGSGYLTIPRMAKTGVLLDLCAAFVSAAWTYAIVRFVL